MKIGTIYYLIPDIFKTRFSIMSCLRALKRGHVFDYIRSCFINNKKAIGGIKIFYQHVKYLRELGYDAQILALGGFDGNLYYPDITSLNVKDVGCHLKENDIVVATEFCPYDALKFTGPVKILFNQNWIWLKEKMAANDKDKSYRDIGYDHVISCGGYITQSIEMINNEPCVSIQNGVDPSVFFADDNMREDQTVLCLTRKNSHDIMTIKAIVEREVPTARFKLVDGLTEAELALEYRKSDIFLATGYPEGFALPPLEAMMSGCVVVGFNGRGGREYLTDGVTGLIAEDGDCVVAAKKLVEVLNDKHKKEEIRRTGLAVTTNFTREAMKDRIGKFYAGLEND